MTIKCPNGYYLVAEQNGTLTANTRYVDMATTWEYWPSFWSRFAAVDNTRHKEPSAVRLDNISVCRWCLIFTGVATEVERLRNLGGGWVAWLNRIHDILVFCQSDFLSKIGDVPFLFRNSGYTAVDFTEKQRRLCCHWSKIGLHQWGIGWLIRDQKNQGFGGQIRNWTLHDTCIFDCVFRLLMDIRSVFKMIIF